MLESIVIVGAGMAALRTGEALRAHGFSGRMTFVGAEQHMPYDRPPLSKQVLAGTWEPDRVALSPAPDLGAIWELGATVRGLELASRCVELEDGRQISFDGLVVATGAEPRRLPETLPAQWLHTLRTVEDSLTLRRALAGARRIVVIGAGFIGAEVASTAAALGVEVVMLEADEAPMRRTAGLVVGRALERMHRAHGVDVRCGRAVDRVEAGEGSAAVVRTCDGECFDADLVVVGIGASPATGWLAGSGVRVDDGVVCDAWCRVLADDGEVLEGVVAAGDVARWWYAPLSRTVRLEHWSNAVEQAEHAAVALVDGGAVAMRGAYTPIPYVWSDQHRHKLQFLGFPAASDEVELVDGEWDGPFVAVYRDGDRVTAAAALDRPAQLMRHRAEIAVGLRS